MPELLTYLQGPHVEAMKDITEDTMVNICEELKERTDEANLEPAKKADFRPQAISEGGIHYCHEREYDSDDCEFKQRKSFRIGFNSSEYGTHNWPWLNEETVMTDWRDSTNVIMKKGQWTKTWLKAWEPAPMFTRQELKIIFEVLEKHGLKRDGKIPFKYQLDYQAQFSRY